MYQEHIIQLAFVIGAAFCAFALYDAIDALRLEIGVRRRRIDVSVTPAKPVASETPKPPMGIFRFVFSYSLRLSAIFQLINGHAQKRQLLIIAGGSMVFVWTIAFWVFHAFFVGAVFGLIASSGSLWAAFRYFEAQRIAAIMKDFPQAIDSLTRCLSAGFDMNRSLSIVSDELNSDLKNEFRYLLRNRDYGQSLGEAFRMMASRLESRDIAFLASLISIQERSGGPMAVPLESLSTILKDRERLTQKRMTASAEARMSALILGGLPVIVSMALFSINASYRDVLIGTQAGRIFLLIALVLLTIGSFVMYRMIRTESGSRL